MNCFKENGCPSGAAMGCGQSTDGFSNYGITIDRSTLEEYLKIEREIAEEENNNLIPALELKSGQLSRLSQEINAMEARVKELERESHGLRLAPTITLRKLNSSSFGQRTADSVETHQFFRENGIQEDPLTREQESYLDAANRKEIAVQELETHRRQKDQVAQEVAKLEKHAMRLQELYKRHDDLLERLFGGEYGSAAENQLEGELDELEAHRGRILEANFKWRQAQMMLEYACKQLAVAVQKWQDLPAIPTIDLEIRYSVAAETRNNLVAAGQNIQGAQHYLEKVEFPYCAPDEVRTLNKQATEYVFTDMQSPERHHHAHACYSTTHKRANALLQWFDTVINTTIMKDLNDINEKVKSKTLELRRERIRLIQEKVRELWGTDIELDSNIRSQDMDLEAMSRLMLMDGQVVKLDSGDLESERAGTPPLLSDDELAPMPSNTIIFGNMYDYYHNQLNSLAKQHQEEMEMFMKEQESNARRINENLQDKLMARRQRRARLKVEQAQKNALSS